MSLQGEGFQPIRRQVAQDEDAELPWKYVPLHFVPDNDS